MKKGVLWAFLLLPIFCISQHADALEIKIGQLGSNKVVLLKGGFDPGDSINFADAVRRAGSVDEVWFDSPGGVVDEGLEIGRKIRSLGLATRIRKAATCGSICTFAFLGGVIRYIDPGGRFGVHMFSTVRSVGYVEAVMELIKAEGPQGAAKLILFVEQESALTAKKLADYLIEMSVSLRLLFPNFETSHLGATYLTRQELVSYNVVNTRN